jgi:hypothetical protein
MQQLKHTNQISEEKICVHEVDLSIYTIYILLLHASCIQGKKFYWEPFFDSKTQYYKGSIQTFEAIKLTLVTQQNGENFITSHDTLT